MEIFLQIMAAILSGGAIGAMISFFQAYNLKRKQLTAEAGRSIYKRVESYYRIIRRTKSENDIISIRNFIHETQEENEYYKILLVSESEWFGNRYILYMNAIQLLTGSKMKKAWEFSNSGPGVQISTGLQLNHSAINKLSLQFAKDARRFTNPLMCIWMRMKDNFREVRAYEIEVTK